MPLRFRGHNAGRLHRGLKPIYQIGKLAAVLEATAAGLGKVHVEYHPRSGMVPCGAVIVTR
jgi:hypothetical protein